MYIYIYFIGLSILSKHDYIMTCTRVYKLGECERFSWPVHLLPLQFLTRSIGEERTALVPVIHTMLKLNDDEKDLLMAIANGDEQHQTVQKWSGWGSYLHRWSGIT